MTERRLSEKQKISDIPCETMEMPKTFSIFEDTISELKFNVMPDRPVTEKLLIKEYRIGPRYIESVFDRTYCSSMEHSPSHLVFLSALVHTQKMLYTYFCHEFELEYDPFKKEKLKIWPTIVNVKMPKMITEEGGISHKMWITRFIKRTKTKFFIETKSNVNDIIVINGSAMILLI